jgi:hypothetical protein
MANLIQIKRSANTATPTTLANGELAFSSNSDVLFIGDLGNVTAIAGARNPGTLTANQALVANSTSGIDKIIVANAVVTTITANGVTGTDGQILTSNGTVSYWANPASSALTITGETGSDVINTGETLAFAAANGISTAVTNNQVTFSVDTGSTLVVNATGIHVNSANLSIAASQLSSDVALGSGTSGDYVATITAGAGISGSSTGEGGAATIAVVANNGLFTNTSGVFVVAGAGIASNSTGVHVVGGDGLVANATGVHVGAANGINVAADSVGVTTGSTLTVNSTGVHVNSALSITDLSLSGNLTVTGTLTTLDTVNLVVQDPLIKLANGNSSTDSLDVGFYGLYGATGAKYTGLFRDASDGVYKLFVDSTVEPTSTVDTGASGYTTATLQAFLTSGGLVSNATNVSITANSTLAVAITANTLTLATPLAVGSGGLGLSSITAGAILVGNGAGTATVLAAGTDGFVLQSNGTSVVYGTLDGGSF